jgi:aminoglycoside 3-N-acetyltransferase
MVIYMEKNNVTKEMLIKDFRSIGINEGDMIYVHSSLKSIGWLENGTDTLTDAFLYVLGEDGTLSVPTHTLSFIERGVPPYEPDKTLSLLGTYPNAVWRVDII